MPIADIRSQVERDEQRRRSLLATLALVSCVVLTVAVLVVRRRGEPVRGLEPVELVTGEWPPYSGEGLPAHGLAAAIVERTLRELGYEARLRFLPWGLATGVAEACETDDGPRGAFPYFRNAAREADFYFVEPALLSAPATLFHRADRPLAPDVELAELGRTHRFVLQEGYAYAPEIEAAAAAFECERCAARWAAEPATRPADPSVRCTCAATGRAASFRDAITRLLASAAPSVVPEGLDVGLHVLRREMKEELRRVAWLPPRAALATPVHLMLTRRNPANRELAQRIGAMLAELQRSGEVDALLGPVRARLADDGSLVAIRPAAGAGIVWAEREGGRFAIPSGTRARVVRWSAEYYAPAERAGAAVDGLRVRVRLLDGPMAGAEASVRGDEVEFEFLTP